MKSFGDFITERYINAFVAKEKELYVDDVWKIIQDSYRSIGGHKGTGFASKQDMIDKIPFWKMVRKNGKIVAVAMYRDKGGRKRVAVGTDGTSIGKEELTKIYVADFNRAYFEVSGASFGLIVKTLGEDFVKKYAKSPEEAEKIEGKGKFVEPNSSELMYKRFPGLRKYMYGRPIGGEVHTKIMLGTNGLKVVVKEE